MAFISTIIGRSVVDMDGTRIGTLKDLVARSVVETQHPLINAVVVQGKDKTLAIPYKTVAALISPVVALNCRADEIPAYTIKKDDILLAHDVLDKQIIDTDGARVVRVNDLELVRVNGTLYVSNVDVSAMGIFRRLGLGGVTQRLAERLGVKPAGNPISWGNVELLRRDQSMRLKVPAEKIAELHPADVAEIIDDLNKLEGGQVLQSLDLERLADTLEEVEPDFQASLIEGMPDEKVADVLEKMEPDEAADLLAELPKERSANLLALMEAEEAEDIRKLLAYPEESAGGIMTTEYAALHPELTAEQAITALRQMAEEAETIFYVYVTDQEDHLLGVFSLSDLIFAQPKTPVADFMNTHLITVDLLDDQEGVAQTISKYNLLAVPVVDEEHRLQGIVTADDALDKIIPTAWKKRLPRFYR
jgi:magnesium transporter